MEINKIVEKIVKKCDTRDPFKIAEKMNIIILYEEFENIRGFYNKCYRQKFIHLNNGLNEKQRLFTLSHEIGHAVLHPNANTPFLRDNTFFSINKLEREANIFACELLYPDSVFEEYKEISIYDISVILELDINLVKYRMDRIGEQDNR
ncbi:MAG: ImmA/IrrE family metallo-endopeptidase [Firmicutes bacterium]|nr:ImmA/IrrE family metallo-endopeptidase [Bacillota bacterium]